MIRTIHPVARLLLPLTLALSLALPAAAQSEDCRTDVDYASRAEASLAEAQYDSAIDAYSCLIETAPENYDAYLGRAAATIYAAAVRGDVDFNVTPDLNVVYDEAYDLLTGAISDAGRTLQDDPADLEAHALRGYLYWYTGQNQNALADFDAMLREDDGNVYAYLFRGAANQYLGNEAKAAADFNNAIEMAAEPAGVYAQVGAMYANTGDLEQGIEYYTLAIEAAPDNATYYSYRAFAYDDMGDQQAAIADYSRAIELEPDNENHYLNRAWQYEQLEDYAAAADDYASAIEANPDNANTYQRLGWALIEQEAYTEAVTAFDEGLAIDPNDRWAYLGRATAQSRLGSVALGARDFESYIELTQSYLTDADAMKPGNSRTLELSEGQVYAIPLNAEAGSTISIEATAQTDDVDPLFLLVGVDGVPLAGSDDVVNGDLNSALYDLNLTETGRYTLLVTHAGGGSYGTLDVDVTLVSAASTLLPTPVPTDTVACVAGAEDNANRALELIDAYNYEGALVAWDCAIEAAPDNAQYYLRRGLTGLTLAPEQWAFDDIDYADALDVTVADDEIDTLAARLEANPSDLYALTGHAYLLWLNARDEEAMVDYAALLDLNPENATALLFRGSSNQYLGNTEAAAPDFERVLEMEAGNTGVLSVIIYSYLDTGDDVAGLDYLNRYLEIAPDSAPFLAERAQVYSRAQDFAPAMADMERAIEIAPDVATYYGDLGWIQIRAGVYADAVDAFNSARELDPSLQYVVLGLGTAQTALGNVAEGAQAYADYIGMIEVESPDHQITNGTGTLLLEDGVVYRLPLLLNAGQSISMEAVSVDGGVDPLILLVGPDGTPLIGNDDTDILGGDYDARIFDYSVPQDGAYTLVVTHSGAGSVGDVDVTVSGLDVPVVTPTKTK